MHTKLAKLADKLGLSQFFLTHAKGVSRKLSNFPRLYFSKTFLYKQMGGITNFFRASLRSAVGENISAAR